MHARRHRHIARISINYKPDGGYFTVRALARGMPNVVASSAGPSRMGGQEVTRCNEFVTEICFYDFE